MTTPYTYRHNHNSPDLDQLSCRICRGTGTTYEEHPDGSLSEHACPYCKGTADSVWVKERFDVRTNKVSNFKLGIAGYAIALGATNLMHVWTASPGLKVVHFMMWIALVVALIWGWLHPAPRKRKRRAPHPLTTDREKLMGAAVLGGLYLKGQYDHNHRHQQQQQQQQPRSPAQWW